MATKHVPKVFGDIDPTIEEVTHDGRKVFEKSLFSMMEPPMKDHLLSLSTDDNKRD